MSPAGSDACPEAIIARRTYGGSVADQRTNDYGSPKTQEPYYLWTQPGVGQGSQVVDVLPLGNNTIASGVLNTGASSYIYFQGPDGFDDPLYASVSPTAMRVQVTGPVGVATKDYVIAAVQAAVATVVAGEASVYDGGTV